VGNTRAALISLGRALQLDPKHALARQQLWEIHRELEISQLTGHPEIIPLLNFNLCLERVAQLLLQDKPRPEQVQEAHHLPERLESMPSVDRQPAKVPNDPAAWNLKRMHYSDGTELDYDSAMQGHTAPSFDHEYTKQLGLALIVDSERWPRGCEYLRLAARGL